MVTYRNVMRERSFRIRLRSSHHRSAPLQISHHKPGPWIPPVKEADEQDERPGPRHGRGRGNKR